MKSIIVGILVLYSSLSFAITGNELYSQMQDKSRLHGGIEYVQGIMDMQDLFQFFDALDAEKEKRQINPQYICSPSGSTYGQAYDIIKNYLANHPENRNQYAASLSYAALAEFWKCNK